MKKIIFLSLTAIFVFISSCSYAIEASSILNFESSVTFDSRGNEWTAYGNPVLSNAESHSGGNVLYLDGNSYIQAKDTKPFDFPGEFTLSAWIYPQKLVTDHYGGESFSIFSRWFHGIRTLYLIDIGDGKLSFYSDFAGAISLVSKSSVPLNQWTHIAVTRDSNNVMRLFINGKLEAEKTIARDFSSTDYPMTIGASSNAMRKSIGCIEDCAVYKKCLYTSDFDVSGYAHKGEVKKNENENENANLKNEKNFSVADEIRKFKSLLDDGIITQEEFDAQKKKLLGL